MQIDIKTEEFIPGKTRIKYGGAYVGKEERQAIDSVLDRNWWTIDEHARMFEKELAQKTGVKHAVVTNSGSSALFTMYCALREKLAGGKLQDNGEIITGAIHFPTAISSMLFNGFTPVYVDVDVDTSCIDPKKIESAITDKTVAILVVSVAGNIPNLQEIIRIAKKHDLRLILDNCDGYGGQWDDRFIECYFDIASTSFHAAHIMNTGEGGAVFTNDDFFGEVARSVREWGRVGDTDSSKKFEGIPEDYPGRYIFQYLGMNIKPIELQCAMGREQLKKLEVIKELRETNFKILYKILKGLKNVSLPFVHLDAVPSWFSFPMIVEDRKGLREFLESRNIETRTIFGGNILKQPAYKNYGRAHGDLTNADIIMEKGMFVSVHPNNTPPMMQYVAESIIHYYKEIIPQKTDPFVGIQAR